MALEIIQKLEALGVTIQVIPPDRLRLQPASLVPRDLIQRVRQEKPEILTFLMSHPKTCADTCYRVDATRLVHHPWNGCRTILLREVGRVVEGPCWHCGGRKECGCIACCSVDGAGQCLTCRGSGVTVGWVQ